MNKEQLYIDAYDRVLQKWKSSGGNIKDVIKKLVFYGVKWAGAIDQTKPKTIDKRKQDFAFYNMTYDLIKTLTPKEFMNIFPIEKKYDGKRYQCKDYFYTMDYLKTLDLDMVIGEEIDSFLWEYQNWDVADFVIEMMSIVSDLRRFEGKKSLMEEWADKNDIETFTKCKDAKGKEYLLSNKTGKTVKISKPRPRYLKVIK